MRINEWRRELLAVVVLALGAWAGQAGASGFQLTEQNASGLGNAYAGQAAAAEDASTIFFNPAGLTRIPGVQLVGAANFVILDTHFHDHGSKPASLVAPLGGEDGNGGGLSVVPSGYVSWEAWHDTAWVGVGVNVPFGLTTEWDNGWMGRFHALKSDIKTVNVNPTVAWKLSDWLSIGAGANWQWITAELSNAVSYSTLLAGVNPAALPALAGCPGASLTGAGCEGVATVKADTRSWGWNAGAMLSLPTNTRIGASYRSAITHNLEGHVTFSNRPQPTGIPAIDPVIAAINGAVPDGGVRATIKFPDTASVAVSQQIGSSLQLLADYTWTGWSAISNLSIYRTSGVGLASTPLAFKNSWRVGLGANYQLNDMWKVRGGFAYDKTPVQDAFRTPRLPDQDRTWLAGGAQWAFSRQGAIDVGLAYLFVKNASSNLPSIDPSQPPGFTPTPKGTLVGEYTANVWIASAQARYSF